MVVAVSSDVVVVVLWHVVLVVDDFDGWKKDKDEDGLEKAAATGRRLHARRRRMVFFCLCLYLPKMGGDYKEGVKGFVLVFFSLCVMVVGVFLGGGS